MSPTPPTPPSPPRLSPRMDFSVGGLVYFAMMLFMGLAAVNTQANLLFGVFGLMIGILLLSWQLGRIVLQRLVVKRVLPANGVTGVRTSFEYEITNNKRYWPSLSVTLTELDGTEGFVTPIRCYMLHAAAKMTARVPAEVYPRCRGLFELDRFQMATRFPFGFIGRARTARKKDAFLVFPTIGAVDRRLLALCRSADDTGESLRPTPGGSDEFYGIRQYRAGDSPRRIYWRRSARTGLLLTKEMTRVAPPRLLLVVETLAAGASVEAHANVERTIAMAASLASAALDDGLSVGLCAWAGAPVVIAPSRGKQQREELLSLLARLPPNMGNGAKTLLADCRSVLKPDTTTVLLTPVDQQLDFLEEARGTVLLLSAVNKDCRRWFHFAPDVDFAACIPLWRNEKA